MSEIFEFIGCALVAWTLALSFYTRKKLNDKD